LKNPAFRSFHQVVNEMTEMLDVLVGR
jgi:hypothetical protein